MINEIYAKASHLIQINRVKEAEKIIGEGLFLEPDHAGLLLLLANCKIANMHWEESEDILSKIIAQQPDRSHAYYLLAHIYNSKSKFRKALQFIETALFYEPENVQYLIELSTIQCNAGEEPEAVGSALLGLQKDPDNATLYGLLGFIKFKLNVYDEALAYLEKGLSLEPNNAELLHYLGLVLSKEGKYSESYEKLLGALRNNPNYKTAAIKAIDVKNRDTWFLRWQFNLVNWYKENGIRLILFGFILFCIMLRTAEYFFGLKQNSGGLFCSTIAWILCYIIFCPTIVPVFSDIISILNKYFSHNYNTVFKATTIISAACILASVLLIFYCMAFNPIRICIYGSIILLSFTLPLHYLKYKVLPLQLIITIGIGYLLFIFAMIILYMQWMSFTAFYFTIFFGGVFLLRLASWVIKKVVKEE